MHENIYIATIFCSLWLICIALHVVNCILSVKPEVIYFIGGKLVWEMNQFIMKNVGSAVFFPEGVEICFFGYDHLSIRQAGAVINSDVFADQPSPTIVVFSLGAQEIKEVGNGDISPIAAELVALATMTKCKFRKVHSLG